VQQIDKEVIMNRQGCDLAWNQLIHSWKIDRIDDSRRRKKMEKVMGSHELPEPICTYTPKQKEEDFKDVSWTS